MEISFAPVKRETGVSPVRTRHCKRGVEGHYATGEPGRRPDMLIRKSGDLPYVGTGMMNPKPRDPGCTKEKVSSDACFSFFRNAPIGDVFPGSMYIRS